MVMFNLELISCNQCESTHSSPPLPLWAIQSRILLSVFALFTGDTAMVTTEFQQLGFYVIVSFPSKFTGYRWY